MIVRVARSIDEVNVFLLNTLYDLQLSYGSKMKIML